MELIELKETRSTNTYVKEHSHELPDEAVVYTHHQSAGRGQKGNSWEAEPGKNLTFSLLLHRPAVEVKRQFLLSEAVALATVETLDSYADGFAVKWPNDIYHHDRKIAGILIEQSLDGPAIDYSVIGIGLNVNQRVFVSDAPNPVSLANITGEQYELVPLLRQLCANIIARCDNLGDTNLHDTYMSRLWRNDGKPHPCQLPDGTRFEASIADVAPDGTLTLRHNDNTLHDYQFKEVAQLL